MEEQLCAVRGLAPQAPAGPGEAPLPSWEGGVTDAAAAAPGGAGELDGAGESLAYLLSTGDGGLDVSKLYALAMGAHLPLTLPLPRTRTLTLTLTLARTLTLTLTPTLTLTLTLPLTRCARRRRAGGACACQGEPA